jgi:uncharacterized protein (DUF2147 family)
MAGPLHMSREKQKQIINNLAPIKVASMTSFFAPMADILFLQDDDMEAALKAAATLQKWMDSGGTMHADGIPEGDEEDAEKGNQLEIDFDETPYKERAFADHATPHLMRNAADYSDRCFKEGQKEFRVYYICIA